MKGRFLTFLSSKRGKVTVSIVAIAWVAFLGGFTYWERNVMHEKPEYLRARAFVRASVSVRKEFGEPIKVERERRFRYERSFGDSKESSGYFGFSVEGPQGAGAVTVYWTFSPLTQQFTVTRLTRDSPLERSRNLVAK